MTLVTFEDNLRVRSTQAAHLVEVGLHVILAILLALGAVAAVVAACYTAWQGLRENGLLSDAQHVLDRLLVVLIFIEILHTVRLSIRSEALIMEPFLIVGLIASVRRVLVITLQAAQAVQEGQPNEQIPSLFRNSMIELGLLGVLILIFVFSIHLLRRAPSVPEERFSR